MIKTLLENFIKPTIGTDALNGWGMAVQSYRYDEKYNEVRLKATVILNSEKLKSLFDDFIKLLKEQNDPLLELLNGNITDETVKTFNREFLEEYVVDISDAAELSMREKWSEYLRDAGVDDHKDITFNCIFSMSSAVVDIGAITDYKNH